MSEREFAKLAPALRDVHVVQRASVADDNSRQCEPNRLMPMPGRLYNKLHDKAWLRQQYVTKRLTMQQIADKIGCTRQAVSVACKQYGIRARSRYAKRNAKEIGARAHKALLDRAPMLRNRRWLIEQHMTKHRSLSDIAAELGISGATLGKVFKTLGIPVGRYPKLMDKKWLRHDLPP